MKLGKVSENGLKRYVLQQVNNDFDKKVSGASIGVDCAIFSCDDNIYMGTAVQEAAVAGQADTEPVTPIADLFVKVANNLYAGCSRPVAAMVTLLLPEDVEGDLIKEIMKSANEAANNLGMPIIGGQTKVTKAVNLPFAVVTGYSIIDRENFEAPKAKPGQDIVLTKWIGLEGTAIYAQEFETSIKTRYPAYLVEEAAGFGRYLSIEKEAKLAEDTYMHDLSEGGVFAALWEMAEGSKVGLTVDLKKIPIRQETVEVCEHMGVNPYELKSGGSLLITCDDGVALVDKLLQAGINAAIIGKVTDSNDRLILNEDETRYLDRPKMDEIYRISEKRN